MKTSSSLPSRPSVNISACLPEHTQRFYRTKLTFEDTNAPLHTFEDTNAPSFQQRFYRTKQE